MASEILRQLRHPLFDELEQQWQPYLAAAGNVQPATQMLAQVPGLQSASVGIQDGGRIPYVASARETALSVAPSIFGKACEAAAGALSSSDNGKWLSGVSSFYLACYFMARAILYIFGLAPLARDSKITIDLFPSSEDKAPDRPYSNELQVWTTGRWEHDLVWKLLGRVLTTLKAERELRDEYSDFRRIHWDSVSMRRNRYSYSDEFICWNNEAIFSSIPSDALCDIRTLSVGVDFRRHTEEAGFYFALFKILFSFHEKSVRAAKANLYYSPYCDDTRRDAVAA